MNAARSMSVVTCGLIMAAVWGRAAAGAQNESQVAAPSVVVKGVVAGAKGPLANVNVVVSPVDPKSGLAVTVYALREGGESEMANPKSKSDSKGAFSLIVPKALFVQSPPCGHECAHWAPDKLSIAVWPEATGKEPPLEPTIVKIDPAAATVDLGRIVLTPMK